MVGVELYYFSNILSFQRGFVIYYVKEVLWFNLRIFMISVLVLWYLLWYCNNFYRILISVIALWYLLWYSHMLYLIWFVTFVMVCDIWYDLWHLLWCVTFVMVCDICYGLWYLLLFVIFIMVCDICYVVREIFMAWIGLLINSKDYFYILFSLLF